MKYANNPPVILSMPCNPMKMATNTISGMICPYKTLKPHHINQVVANVGMNATDAATERESSTLPRSAHKKTSTTIPVNIDEGTTRIPGPPWSGSSMTPIMVLVKVADTTFLTSPAAISKRAVETGIATIPPKPGSGIGITARMRGVVKLKQAPTAANVAINARSLVLKPCFFFISKSSENARARAFEFYIM